MPVNNTLKCGRSTKVVIRLPVNRLPVKLPVTGFNFQLPVTDLPTFFLHLMQISASASSHTLTQANKDRSTLDPDIPAPSNSSVPLVQVYPVFDCRVCSSPLPTSGRCSRESLGGKRCELDGQRG